MIFLKPSDHSLRWKKEADPEGPRIVGSGGQPVDFLDLVSLSVG